jgi:serine/threonine protein phosphatase PrpC
MNSGKSYAVVSEQNAQYKPVNQDSGFAGSVKNRAGLTLQVAVVADGISGAYKGERASKKAVEGFYNYLVNSSAGSPHQMAEEAPAFFNQIHQQIKMLSDAGSGTTFTAAVVFPTGVIILHVGDSRAYYVSNGSCKLLTTDHTVLASAVKKGVSEDDLDSINAHALERCLGIDTRVDPEIIVNPPGVNIRNGTLVLTTDGVHDVIPSSQIIYMLEESSNIKSFCTKIVENALVNPTAAGKPNKDNITIAAMQLGSQQPAYINKTSNLKYGAKRRRQKNKKSNLMMPLLVGCFALVVGAAGYTLTPWSEDPNPSQVNQSIDEHKNGANKPKQSGTENKSVVTNKKDKVLKKPSKSEIKKRKKLKVEPVKINQPIVSSGKKIDSQPIESNKKKYTSTDKSKSFKNNKKKIHDKFITNWQKII